jgi:hypothetical protein
MNNAFGRRHNSNACVTKFADQPPAMFRSLSGKAAQIAYEQNFSRLLDSLDIEKCCDGSFRRMFAVFLVSNVDVSNDSHFIFVGEFPKTAPLVIDVCCGSTSKQDAAASFQFCIHLPVLH